MLRALLAASASVVLVGAVLASSACIIPSISEKDNDAGSSATPASSSDGGSSAASAVQGASCTAITASISLCQYISACPDLTLNVKVFPECGFRIHGSAIDPECLCENEYLCPIGSPTTCTEAAQAAGGDTTYDSVCEQVGTGGCKDLTAGTGAGSTTSAACQQCVSSCDNVPSCIDACGC